jgi:ferredoxin
MPVQLVADVDACIGSGECVATDPDAVELGEEGTVRILQAVLEEARANDLCEACPVGALSSIEI